MKAFLFDMDGVLIDSEPIHTRVKRETLEYYGLHRAGRTHGYYTVDAGGL